MNKLLDFFEESGLKAAAPFVVLSVLLSAALVLGMLKLSDSFGGTRGTVTVAVFDVVKFANAQRAVASTFLGKSQDVGEAGTLLLSLSKKTSAAIEKVAGPGTLVLVKQGVVSGSQLDITNAVLEELGLPTSVPTSEPMTYLSEVAPTMLVMPRRPSPSAPDPAQNKGDANASVLP